MTIREELRACAAMPDCIPYGMAAHIVYAFTFMDESLWLISHEDRSTFLLLVVEAL